MVVAPASTATVIISMRKAGSERVPSSVENSTSSTKVRARRTADRPSARGLRRGVILSLAERWRSEEARKTWMRALSAGSTAWAAASMSSRLQRASEAMRGPLTFAGDLADGVGVAWGGDGEAGFEDVNAEIGEAVGHAELLVRDAWCSRGTALRRGAWCRRRRCDRSGKPSDLMYAFRSRRRITQTYVICR